MSNSPWIESFAPVIAAIEQAAYQRGWNDALASMALPSIATEPEPVEITDLDDIQVMAEPSPPKPRKPRQYVPVKDMIGESFTLAELLDSLQGHAKKFKMMRRSDPASAEIFETFGCAIVANQKVFDSSRLEPYFLDVMPSLGCVYFPEIKSQDQDDDDSVYPTFLYFQKEKRPVNVQQTNGLTYRIGGVWELEKNKPVVSNFFISLAPDGTVKTLKQCQPAWQKPGFCRMEWNYPSIAVEGAQHWNRKKNANISTDDWSGRLFAWAANAVIDVEEGLQVRAKMGSSDTAVFSIPMLSTPYFFADRNKTVNHNGRTRRIVHIVRGHQRSDGQYVKSHFRGVRTFTWKGFDISVGLRGLHGPMPTAFSAESWNETEVKRLGLSPDEFRDFKDIKPMLERAWQ